MSQADPQHPLRRASDYVAVSNAVVTASALDSVGRLIGNVGVPAAIAFFILYQITPRLDQMAALQVQANTQLTVIAATCGSAPLPPRATRVVTRAS